MNRQTIITLIFLLIWNVGFAQKPLIELDIHNKKIGYYINLEQKLGSKKFDTEQTYVKGRQTAQPEIFRRKEAGLPDLLVYYTYFKRDSTISEILYEWDVYNFDKKDHNIQSKIVSENLIKKYNQIINFINSKYGESNAEGNLNDLSLINNSQGLNRKDTWSPNDSLKISAYTTLSNFYKKDQFVTINPTYKIRVYINNLKEEKPLTLSTDQVKSMDRTFNEFVKLLSEDKFDEITKLLSDEIVKTVTIDILKQIKTGINIDKKFDLYMNGMKMLPDGNTYAMLQYKYSDDTNLPPKEYIAILFDGKNKILNLQPMRQE